MPAARPQAKALALERPFCPDLHSANFPSGSRGVLVTVHLSGSQGRAIVESSCLHDHSPARNPHPHSGSSPGGQPWSPRAAFCAALLVGRRRASHPQPTGRLARVSLTQLGRSVWERGGRHCAGKIRFPGVSSPPPSGPLLFSPFCRFQAREGSWVPHSIQVGRQQRTQQPLGRGHVGCSLARTRGGSLLHVALGLTHPGAPGGRQAGGA